MDGGPLIWADLNDALWDGDSNAVDQEQSKVVLGMGGMQPSAGTE